MSRDEWFWVVMAAWLFVLTLVVISQSVQLGNLAEMVADHTSGP